MIASVSSWASSRETPFGTAAPVDISFHGEVQGKPQEPGVFSSTRCCFMHHLMTTQLPLIILYEEALRSHVLPSDFGTRVS